MSKLLRYSVLFLFLGCCPFAFAQNFFQNTYDIGILDEARTLCPIGPSSNWLICGTTRLNGLNTGFFLVLDPSGNTKWYRSYEVLAPEPPVFMDAEQALFSSSALVLCNKKDPASALNYSYWFLLNGDSLTTGIDGIRTDPGVQLSQIYPIQDGFLLTGNSLTLGDEWPTLCKIDANGNILWATKIQNAGKGALGNVYADPVSGFIYASGTIQNPANNSNDGLLTCFNAQGDLLWTKRVGAQQEESLSHVVALGGDALLWLGETRAGNASLNRIWALKTTNDGEIKSNTAYQLPDRDLSLRDVQMKNQRTTLAMDASKSFNDNAVVLMTINDNGDILWNKTYNAGSKNNHFYQLKRTASNKFVAVGTRSTSNIDILLIQTDTLGKTDASCCPTDLDLNKTELQSPIEVFVPDQDHSIEQSAILSGPGLLPGVQKESLCTPIALDFSLSDSLICPGECVMVQIDSSTAGVNYFFTIQGGSPDPLDPACIRASQEGTLKVTRTGSSAVCMQSQQKTVMVHTNTDRIPNAFTPDGDGVNDRFFPIIDCPVSSSRFEVFNRWGERVYAAVNNDQGWDGTLNATNHPCPLDVYVWHLEFEVIQNGQTVKVKKKGEINLLR